MTTRWVLLVSCRPEATALEAERWFQAVDALASSVPDVLHSSAGPNLVGSVADCDATWDLETVADTLEDVPAIAALLGAPVGSAEQLALQPVATGYRPGPTPLIKRTLALAVRATATERDVAGLERSLLAMPEHISEIRSWALSKVRRSAASVPWTHVWEQEFDSVDDLRGSYLAHPYHWTGVERWFDPEIPGSVVEPRLAHICRATEAPILVRQQA